MKKFQLILLAPLFFLFCSFVNPLNQAHAEGSWTVTDIDGGAVYGYEGCSEGTSIRLRTLNNHMVNSTGNCSYSGPFVFNEPIPNGTFYIELIVNAIAVQSFPFNVLNGELVDTPFPLPTHPEVLPTPNLTLIAYQSNSTLITAQSGVCALLDYDVYNENNQIVSHISGCGGNGEIFALTSPLPDGKLHLFANKFSGVQNNELFFVPMYSGDFYILDGQFYDHEPIVTPQIQNIGDAHFDEGTLYSNTISFLDEDSTSWTANIDYGDGSATQTTQLTNRSLVMNHSYNDNGIYTITIAVADNQGHVGYEYITVNSDNVAPIASIGRFGDGTVNVPFAILGTFFDRGILDTHTAVWDWGDGTTSPGVLTEENAEGTINNTHIYAQAGNYTITLTVTDDDNASVYVSKSVLIKPDTQLTALSPANVWVSKTFLSFGVRFDLLAEVYKDTTLVSSGQVNGVQVGSGNFNQATQVSIPFNSFTPVNFASGSALKVKVSVRNACSGSLLNSGTARLWFNTAQLNSRFGATIANTSSSYYLRNAFALSQIGGTGPRQNIDIAAGAMCSAFKPFGTWSITP